MVLTSVGFVGSAASASVTPPVESTITARVAPEAAPSPYATREGVVVMIANRHRRNNGIAPLYLHSSLTLAASRHSQDMAAMRRVTHTGSDGSNAGQRITRAGFRWRAWGENVAAGYSSTTSVMNGWMSSPSHKANILNRTFRYAGVACYVGNGSYWWTMNLAA